MAEVDSIEIKLSADASKASKAIDVLIGKLGSFSKSLGSIDVSAMSNAAKSLSQNLSSMNDKGFSELNKTAKEAQKTVNQISATAKKGIRSKISFDTSEYQKVMKELSVKFSEAGKSFKPEGNITQLQKQLDKLNSEYDKLIQKEEKIISVGKTSPEVKTFHDLQYDIAKTENKIDILEKKLKELGEKAKEIPSLKILDWSKREENRPIQEQEKTVMIPKSSIGYNESAMVAIYGENAKGIKNYEEFVKKFGNEAQQAFSGMGENADKAKEKTDSLGNKVDGLKEKLNKLKTKGFNIGGAEFDKTYTELQKTEGELKEYKNGLKSAESATDSLGKKSVPSFNNISNSIKKLTSGISAAVRGLGNIASPFKKVSNASNGLIRNFGKLFIAFQSLRGIGKLFSSAFTEASDYIEGYNYFDVSLSKIAKESKKDYKKYGYESAETYAESFQKRLNALTSKMSGANIGKGGELSFDINTKSSGLDVTQLMEFESRIAQMTNSVGMIGEASLAASEGLTMLAGDMSSLANIPLEQVMSNFSSALSGSAMAVKKYGIDTSVASLKQTALSIGVKKSVNEMTQAEKQYLRVITIINQSKVAWGDLANTINQPANQLRMLKNNFKQVAMMIGKLFMPVIQKVLPWINAMVIAIKDLVQWIGDFFGIKWDNSSIAAPDDNGYADMESDAEGLGDAIAGAAKEQKKFNKQLQGFDELNNLTSTDKDKDKDKDSGADVSGVLSDALINAVEDYKKRWNKAFEAMKNDAEELAKKIEEVFKKDWAIADFTDVGETLGKWLKDGLEDIPWDDIKENAKKVGKSLGTLINGFVEVPGLGTTIGKAIANAIDTAVLGLTSWVETVHWDSVGSFIANNINALFDSDLFPDVAKLLAESLNAAFQTIGGFSDTFEWEEAGKTIVKSLNEFLDTFDAEKNGLNFGKFVSGIATTLYTVVSDEKTWEKLGDKLGEGIKGFFEGMNIEDEKTGLTGWETLGKTISSTFSGFATTITRALKTVPWEEVGQSIADFISSIDFLEITWNLIKLTDAFFDALVDGILGFVKTAPLESAVIGLFATLKLTGLGSTLSATIERTLGTEGITLSKVAISIAGIVIAAKAGFSIGKEIGEWISKQIETEDMDDYRYDFSFSDLFSYSPSEWQEGIFEMFDALNLDEMIEDALSGNFHFTIPFTDIELPSWNEITTSIKNGIGDIKGAFSLLSSDIKNGDFKFKIGSFEFPSWNEIKEAPVALWRKIKEWWNENVKLPKIKMPSIANFGKKLETKWEAAKTWWSKNVKLPKIKLPTIADIKAGVETAWEAAKTWWNNNVKLPSLKFTAIAKSTAEKWLKPVVDVLNSIIDGFNDLMKLKWKDFKIGGKTVVKGGSFTLLSIPKIPGFETGGFVPSQYSMFMAGENGVPEMLGTVGGRTAVAGGMEITGIRDAIYETSSQEIMLLREQNNILMQLLSKNTGITPNEVFNAVRRENVNYKRRTGHSAFAN